MHRHMLSLGMIARLTTCPVRVEEVTYDLLWLYSSSVRSWFGTNDTIDQAE